MKRLFFALLFSLLWLAGCETTPTPVPILAVTVVLREATPIAPAADPSPTREPEIVCEDAPPVQLIVNQRGRVLREDPRPLNMRSAPGTENPIVWRIDVNEIFYVLDGPECADGYQWFLVRYRTYEGWIAEGDNTSYFVEPFLSG